MIINTTPLYEREQPFARCHKLTRERKSGVNGSGSGERGEAWRGYIIGFVSTHQPWIVNEAGIIRVLICATSLHSGAFFSESGENDVRYQSITHAVSPVEAQPN